MKTFRSSSFSWIKKVFENRSQYGQVTVLSRSENIHKILPNALVHRAYTFEDKLKNLIPRWIKKSFLKSAEGIWENIGRNVFFMHTSNSGSLSFSLSAENNSIRSLNKIFLVRVFGFLIQSRGTITIKATRCFFWSLATLCHCKVLKKCYLRYEYHVLDGHSRLDSFTIRDKCLSKTSLFFSYWWRRVIY